MKISSLNKQISFSKTLVANCSVLNKNDGPIPCKIYSLNQQEDSDYFEKIPNASDWENAKYLCYLKVDLERFDDFVYKDYSIYALENEEGDCLGYSEISNKYLGTDEVTYLETVPSQAYYNRRKSKLKYIGETLLSFMVKKAQKDSKDFVELYPSMASTMFYMKKCFFTPYDDDPDTFYLDKYNFDKLIKNNEQNTNSSIELLA